jgi:hypothetical protein
MYGYCNKLVCLSKSVKLTDNAVIQNAANKLFMLSVDMLSVFMLNVMGPR